MPIGLPELAIILVVALLVFGPKKIPEIANSLGRSINEFRRGSREVEDTVRRELSAGDDRREERREESIKH